MSSISQSRGLVVGCSGGAILLLLALLPLPWARAAGSPAFTETVGSSSVGTLAVLATVVSLGLLVWLGLQHRSLRTVAMAAFALAALWLVVGLGSLLVLGQGVRAGPGLWLAMAAGLLAAGAGAGAILTSHALAATASAAPAPPTWVTTNEWDVPTAPLGTTDPGDNW